MNEWQPIDTLPRDGTPVLVNQSPSPQQEEEDVHV